MLIGCSGGESRDELGIVTIVIVYDCFGVGFRMSAFGENPVEADAQVSGPRFGTAHDRKWVVS